LSSIFFNRFIILYIPTNLGHMAHNVPVVCDVLAAAIKELRSGFSGGQNVAEEKHTKGVSPTMFFCSPIAAGAKHIPSC
jgi:hypothetical protein